jgi:hypothetical protein
MKSRDLLRGPRLPLREAMGGKPLGDTVLVKRGAPLCPSPLYLGFPPRTARVGALVLPIDPWQQGLPGPLPPGRGDGRLLQILVDACPPKIHQRGQLLTDLLQPIVPYGELLVPRSRFQGGDFRMQPAVDLDGGLWAGVVQVKRMQRE